MLLLRYNIYPTRVCFCLLLFYIFLTFTFNATPSSALLLLLCYTLIIHNTY